MSHLIHSKALSDFLHQVSSTDKALYSIEWHGDLDSYKFSANKMFGATPMSYSAFITAEAVESVGAGTAFNQLRQRAMIKLYEAANNGKGN